MVKNSEIVNLQVHEVADIEKKPLINVDALWCMYMCSVVAACNAENVTYPLDLIKTRLQIQGEKQSKIGEGPKKGMLGTTVDIIHKEGLFGLWRGISAVYLRHLIYSGTRLVLYTQMREFYLKRHPDQKTFGFLQGALAGLTAGGIGQYLANPADLIKVQIQMEGKRRLLGLPPRVHGVPDAFIKIYDAGGIRGLWKGWVPSVQRAALVTLGDLATYDLSKRFLQKHTNLPDEWLLHALSSCCAGFAAAILSTPADLIKSRVMNQPTDSQGRGTLYKGAVDCLMKAIKEEGFMTMYKGFLPTWIRLGPWASVFWLTYEHLRILLKAENF
ncbi:mitochondrial uncoupling protein 4-like [Diabrotica virgifera virgifera]|uniref:Mitochondrial uncoupling protein 4 n=1 Tax=Diabrotica virgifera virgifera TaxID=50390 RepID=A0ABM5JK83_DIAVI|nr:mitochondrial uncoupling protein 4-like [Diabrotica virgifera virgifera]